MTAAVIIDGGQTVIANPETAVLANLASAASSSATAAQAAQAAAEDARDDAQDAAADAATQAALVQVSRVLGDTTARTVANSEVVIDGKIKTIALDHTTSLWDFSQPIRPGETIQIFPQDGGNTRVHLCYQSDKLGFAEAGILTEHTEYIGAVDNYANTACPTTTGAKVQVWVVRPTATLPTTNGASVTVNLVAAIGEYPLDDNQADIREHVRFAGLRIPVQAGDLIARRIIGAAIRIGEGGPAYGEYTSTISLVLTCADTTLAGAFTTSKTGTILTGHNSGRRFYHKSVIIKNDFECADNAPGGTARLNSAGRLPAIASTPLGNPWFGKKIAVLGSSISTTDGGGVTSGRKGHLLTAMELLGANAYYFAVGGSYGLWPATNIGGTVASQYVAGTNAEFIARFGAGADVNSYETKIIGKQFDAVIMPDCINDTNAGAFSIGTKDNGDVATLWGAFQRMIEAILADRPSCQIFLQTPAHRWASYGGTGTPTEQANRVQYADAMAAIAEWYSLPPPIDFIRYGGIGPSKVANGNGLDDHIHPDANLTNGPRAQMAAYAAAHMARHGFLTS